eukprot:scaffold91562_cov49-Cyclotella_meneghiniana.AAC.2
MSSYWEPSYQHLRCPGRPVPAVYTPCRTQRSSKYNLIRAVLVISCIAVSTLVVTHLFATRITHLEPGRGWNGTGRSSLHSSTPRHILHFVPRSCWLPPLVGVSRLCVPVRGRRFSFLRKSSAGTYFVRSFELIAFLLVLSCERKREKACFAPFLCSLSCHVDFSPFERVFVGFCVLRFNQNSPALLFIHMRSWSLGLYYALSAFRAYYDHSALKGQP